MNRREFLSKGMAATLAMAGTGMALPACSGNLRSELMGEVNTTGRTGVLGPEEMQILSYASLAPSGHNSQPWFVQVRSLHEWIIGFDSNRRLPAVDPDNREVMLSLGAFIENLDQAAAAYGFRTDVEILARDRDARDVARVVLTQASPVKIPLQRLRARRTVKSHLLPRELRKIDLEAFKRAAEDRLHYFPAGSRHSDFMAEAAVENFRIQFENDQAMVEAALWTRLSDRDARKFRDGLTPDGMEITGLAGFYVRNFLGPGDLKGKAFREKAVEKAAAQAGEGGGWLVIVSDGERVVDLIASGRRFQRMALLARERMVAIHPMTQTLEEARGRSSIRENHAPSVLPQFMLRVGYVNHYPDPVSLRRPVDWFLVT